METAAALLLQRSMEGGGTMCSCLTSLLCSEAGCGLERLPTYHQRGFTLITTTTVGTAVVGIAAVVVVALSLCRQIDKTRNIVRFGVSAVTAELGV